MITRPSPFTAARAMGTRQLLRLRHAPEQLVDVTIQPVMLVILFGYLFAHAFTVPGGNYLSYLMPGMLLQTILFAASGIAVSVAADKTTGFHDRTRTLPAPSWGILLGRVMACTVQNGVAMTVMIAAGLAVGWRSTLQPLAAVSAVVLLLALGWAVAWTATMLGLICRSPEAATAITMLVILPLTFVSDTFIPASAMPGWAGHLADTNPVTHAVDAIRALTSTDTPPVLHALILSLVALVIGVVLMPIASRGYDR